MVLSERHQQILAIMEAGIEYSTEQVAGKIGLKGPRTRQLLNELVDKELLGNRSIVRTLSSLYFCATIVSTTKQSV